MKKWFSAISIAVFLLTACSNVSNEENAVNEQENEVEAIEEEKIEEEAKLDEDDNNEKEETKEAEEKKEKEQTKKAKPKKKNADKKLDALKIHYIDVGQADAALIQYPEGNIVVDTGDWNSTAAVDYLRDVGIKDIDILIGSHPHADHIGQMDKIIEQFHVEEVWMSGDEASSNVFDRAITAIDQADVSYDEPSHGDKYDIGDLTIDIVHPESVNGDFNNGSISFTLTYGKSTFLFTGDAEKEAEQAMVNRGDNLEADVFKLGHHGSKTSTTDAFLDQVDPEIAIISAGKDNSYGHPSSSTIEKVKDKNIDLYATHINGTVVIETNGDGKYSVTTKHDETITTNHAGKKKASNKTGGKPKKKTSKKKSSNTKTTSNNSGKSNNSSSGTCVDINQASAKELEKIIHIGPARAKDVIDARPFDQVDDLTKVNGIADARIADIKQEGIACVK